MSVLRGCASLRSAKALLLQKHENARQHGTRWDEKVAHLAGVPNRYLLHFYCSSLRGAGDAPAWSDSPDQFQMRLLWLSWRTHKLLQ